MSHETKGLIFQLACVFLFVAALVGAVTAGSSYSLDAGKSHNTHATANTTGSHQPVYRHLFARRAT